MEAGVRGSRPEVEPEKPEVRHGNKHRILKKSIACILYTV